MPKEKEDLYKIVYPKNCDRETQPIIWQIHNADMFLKRAEETTTNSLDDKGDCLDYKELEIQSKLMWSRHGRTWFLSFNPKTGLFLFNTNERDEDFFASYKIEIDDTLFEQKEPRQFDRGMAYGLEYNNAAIGVETGKERVTTPSTIVDKRSNSWKFTVTINPLPWVPKKDQQFNIKNIKESDFEKIKEYQDCRPKNKRLREYSTETSTSETSIFGNVYEELNKEYKKKQELLDRIREEVRGKK